MHLLLITVCSEVYFETSQAGQYSKYNLAPDHVPAHVHLWPYRQVIRSSQSSILKYLTVHKAHNSN